MRHWSTRYVLSKVAILLRHGRGTGRDFLVKVKRGKPIQWRSVFLSVSILLSSTWAAAERSTFNFNIPSQKADGALLLFGKQADISVVYQHKLVKTYETNQLKGEFTLQDGIRVLLENSGLKAEFKNSAHLVITQNNQGNEMNNRKKILAATIGFFGGLASVGAQSEEGAQSDWEFLLEEIVVTATKRSQGIQDIAMSVSAIGADEIEKRGLVGMDDYLRTLPGVSMQDRGAGLNSVVIRGIASNLQSETQATGVYFGETPVTGLGSPSIAGAAGNADLKLVDIERIEVLRGPQGTLYGSGSMGGTVRVIPAKPNLQQIEGKVAARYSHTDEQGGDNSMIQGVINIPLIEDELAIRAVAYQFDNSGYINNVSSSIGHPSLATPIALGGQTRDQSDIGEDQYTGFRISALWQPTDALAVALNYSQQDIEQEGIPEVNFELPGDFQQVRLGVGLGGNDPETIGNDIEITNLVIDYDLGWADITSSSSWIDYQAFNNADVNQLLFSLPIYVKGRQDSEVFTEELRLASKFEGPLQFIAGLYYEDNDSESRTPFLWGGAPAFDDPALILGNPAFSVFDSFDTEILGLKSVEQKAFFAEVSYQFTEQLALTLGGRAFEYDQNFIGSGTGFLAGGVLLEVDDNSDSGQNYKANISYTPNDDMLIYGQWSEGFRLGNPRKELIAACDTDQDGLIDGLGVPSGAVEADELESFELGLKSSFADNRVTVNVALYHINWDGIPVDIIAPCGASFIFNAGTSESEGIEFDVQAQLTEHLQLDFSAAYSEATLTEDVPNVIGFGSKGDNLPGSSDYNLSLGLEYGFVIAGYDSFVRGDYAYISEYYNFFDESGPASGGYGQINLRTGLAIDQFNVDLYVNNLTNEQDFSWVEFSFASRAYRVRPRTMGLNLSYIF
ncbi:TonB-dependent receptor [Porticoccaceae bacterium]|nr:TonB-dependent receptor [Porticoccaceae bacterium]